MVKQTYSKVKKKRVCRNKGIGCKILVDLIMDYSISNGLITLSKKLNIPYFERYFKFLP